VFHVIRRSQRLKDASRGRSRRANVIAATIITGSLVLAACGSESASNSTVVIGPLGTVPGIRALVQPPTSPPGFGDVSSDPPIVGGRAEKVGDAAEGSRLLMIGDSILASMATRYGDLACRTLNPLGWSVAVEAEVGRFVDLGVRVVNRKLSQGFDAAVVFLGTNYRGDQDEYRTAMIEILDQLAPRPVIVLTASEHNKNISEVNRVVIEQVGERQNLWLIDWRRLSKNPGMLWRDGIHPTEEGEQFLIDTIAEVLGQAPNSSTGECLPSEFLNDSTLDDKPPTIDKKTSS
jgi:hypothetical protein